MKLTQPEIENLKRAFATDGYVMLPNVVSKEQLSRSRDALLDEYSRLRSSGELDGVGGTLHGHLNCFPGEQSRFVYDTLVELGIMQLVQELSPQPLRMPNVGCNLNLPGSHAQNIHIDGYAATQFMIVNVAPMDIDLVNGAMEICPGTHLRDYKYWEFVLARPKAKRIQMNTGDVMIRTSALWHRGMPNRSKAVRPMIGLTWEDGGSQLPDSFKAHEGKIRIFPNRYTSDFKGRLRERAFSSLPALGSSYRFVRSLVE